MTAPAIRDKDHKAVVDKSLSDVVIRFAGDSGDGMQLTGTQFTNTSALFGNDLSTLPDFPAEIRAPAGTLAGVSAFQVRIADHDIHTPGDAPDVLVAMNPAALKAHLSELAPNGAIIVNNDAFNERNLKKAGYAANPLDDDSLAAYRLYKADITKMTRRTLEDSGLDTKTQDRCKNFFSLGMIYWLFSRSMDPTLEWLNEKFAKRPEIAAANIKVLKAPRHVRRVRDPPFVRAALLGYADFHTVLSTEIPAPTTPAVYARSAAVSQAPRCNKRPLRRLVTSVIRGWYV